MHLSDTMDLSLEHRMISFKFHSISNDDLFTNVNPNSICGLKINQYPTFSIIILNCGLTFR